MRELRVVPVAAALILWLAAATAARAAAPPVPHELPPAAASPHAARSAAPSWIVGVAAAREGAVGALARRFGARPIAGAPAFVVATAAARGLARALAAAGALGFSEPDVTGVRAQAAGPGSLAGYNGWRGYVVAPGLQPPPPGPLLADVDSQVDLAHPAFAGANVSSTSAAAPTDVHGTGVIGIAAGSEPTLGFEGIYPHANVLDVPTGLSCAQLSDGIATGLAHGASVLNMSFGSAVPCFTMYLELMRAVRRGVLPVASAGNEFLKGNPLSYPASYPHVLTVAASDPNNKPAYFSNANLGVDVTAPGIGILLPVPPQFDTADGSQDGWAALSGTSFSAPIVAAVADWIRALRPGLDGGQVADLIRGTAKHLSPAGYDPNSGYGLVQLAPALTAPIPPRGLQEPNDDIPLVDGTVFGTPNTLVWKGAGTATLLGYLDAFKNPADVYRVRLPARSRVVVRLHMRIGSARVVVLPRRARTIAGRALARSRVIKHDGAVRLRNPGAAAVVYVDVQAASVAPAYSLTLRRGV